MANTEPPDDPFEEAKGQEPLSLRQREFLGLARHGYLFAQTPYSIRDAIYGSIPLSEPAYATLDTRWFQRLKHLKQVGPVYLVYPGATHTRFSHSIGVYHLARLALQHLTTLVDVEPEVGRATLAAAMLHDIGHLPYSHVIDELTIRGHCISHTELSIYLITQDEEIRRVLEGKWEVEVNLVADLVGSRPNPRIPKFLYTLLDGPMDIDKLDYLNRDAHHTGVPYGYVEVQRLIDFLAVDPKTGDLAITENGVGTVESVIFAKYLMFRYVYWHHAARIASTMINRGVLDCLLLLGLTLLDIQDPRVRRICLSTDTQLEETLRQLLKEAGQEPPPSLELLRRVEERRLYKRAYAIPCSDDEDKDMAYSDALTRREKEEAIAQALTGILGNHSQPFQDFDILIDVPPKAKLAADVRGVYVQDRSGSPMVLDWETSPYPSYFTGETVGAMEKRLRRILYLCNTVRPKGEELRTALAQHPEIL